MNNNMIVIKLNEYSCNNFFARSCENVTVNDSFNGAFFIEIMFILKLSRIIW